MTKVHREAEIHHKRGRHVLLVGHSGHPEVVGTMGQLPRARSPWWRISSRSPPWSRENRDNLAWVTQTTLSVDDTRHIVAALKEKFPTITGPHKDDICYATTNRQEAVKQVAPLVDAVIVVGSSNSSNSQRLRARSPSASAARSPPRAACRGDRLARLRGRAPPRPHRRRSAPR